MLNETQLYKDNYSTLISKVRQYKKYDFEETLSRANFIFTKCLRRYNPNKGISFSTYLSRALDYDLKVKSIFYSIGWNDIFDTICITEPDIDGYNFSFWKKSLSKNSQKIIDFIFDKAIDIESGLKKITKQKIYCYLKNIGWTNKEIIHCFNEIQLALQEI